VSSGHYVAIVRTGETTWVSCNDNFLTDVFNLHNLYPLVEYALFEAE
jgi:ubiquitin C-terminal hydrolase